VCFSTMNLHDFRRQFQSKGLSRQDLNTNPFLQFEEWMNEIVALDTSDPTAMILATVNGTEPAQRIVLLKQVDEAGFIFFTNRLSAKGRQMAINNAVSLHFPWHFVNRQVIVKGHVEQLTREEDIAYFQSRPKASQWGARASEQSEPIDSRQQLVDRYEVEKSLYPDKVPTPEHWGGFRVIPTTIEFWEGGEDRLHNRFVYSLQEGSGSDDTLEKNKVWSVQRLSP
jgi:pyridoxamine 5'-phosphate oxidase